MGYNGNEQENAQISEFLNDIQKLEEKQLQEEEKLVRLNAKNAEKLAEQKELKDRRLTAKAARATADNSEVLLGRIYKCIKEQARESMVKLNYYLSDASEVAVNAAVEALKADGYTVVATTSNNDDVSETVIKIAW